MRGAPLDRVRNESGEHSWGNTNKNKNPFLEKTKSAVVRDRWGGRSTSVKQQKGSVNGGKEDYAQLNLLGTPEHAGEVDDSVFIASNQLLGTYMQPNFKRQPYIPQSHEYTSRLNNMTGRNLKPLLDRPAKKENQPLFAPFREEYIANRNDIMEKVLAEASRQKDETSPNSRMFEQPAPTIKVAPGVGFGYSAEPNDRPFHPWYRAMPYNIDELRGEVRPDFVLNRNNIGKRGEIPHAIGKAKEPRRRSEAIYGQGNMARIIPGIGAFSQDVREGFAENTRPTVRDTRADMVESMGFVDMTGVGRSEKVNVERMGGAHIKSDNVSGARTGGINREGEAGIVVGESEIKDRVKDRIVYFDRAKMMTLSLDPTLPLSGLNLDTLIDYDIKADDYMDSINDRDGHADALQKRGSKMMNSDGLLMNDPHRTGYIENVRIPTRNNGGQRGTNDGRTGGSIEHRRVPIAAEHVTNDRAAAGNGMAWRDGGHELTNMKVRGSLRGQLIERSHMMPNVQNNRGDQTRVNKSTRTSKKMVISDAPVHGVSERMVTDGDIKFVNPTARRNFSAWDNQVMGLTKTNSNRMGKDGGPRPLPARPTLHHWGLNNQVIMGRNTKTKQRVLEEAKNLRQDIRIKPIMTFK